MPAVSAFEVSDGRTEVNEAAPFRSDQAATPFVAPSRVKLQIPCASLSHVRTGRWLQASSCNDTRAPGTATPLRTSTVQTVASFGPTLRRVARSVTEITTPDTWSPLETCST